MASTVLAHDVISPIELEDIVGSLTPTPGIECIGSGKTWHKQVRELTPYSRVIY